MRQRLTNSGMAVLLCLATGLPGCGGARAISALGRAGAAGASAARVGSAIGRTAALRSGSAVRAGAQSFGRAVPRASAAEIDGFLARGATSMPRGSLGGASEFDLAFESRFARSFGPSSTKEAEVALNPGILHGKPSGPFDSLPLQFRQAGLGSPRPEGFALGSESGALVANDTPGSVFRLPADFGATPPGTPTHSGFTWSSRYVQPGSSTVPGNGALASRMNPNLEIRNARAGWSHPDDLRNLEVRLRLRELELMWEVRTQSDSIPELVQNVESGRWVEAARQADQLSSVASLSSEADAALVQVVELSRRGSALSAAEAALVQPPEGLRDALARVPTTSMNEGLRNAVQRRLVVAEIKEALAGRGNWGSNLKRIDADLVLLRSDLETSAYVDPIADDVAARYGAPIQDRPALGGAAPGPTASLRDMKLSGDAGDAGSFSPAQRDPAVGATTSSPIMSTATTRPQIPEVPAPGFRPPVRESALANLPPLPGNGGKKAHLVALDEYEAKVDLRLERELGRERESVAGHAAHLAHQLSHLHTEGRDRDETLDAQVKAQTWFDRQVALAADLLQGSAGRLSRDASEAERHAVMRLFDAPERVEVLTRRLDRSERAFVRDQSRRGVSPAEFSRCIFIARLLASEPSSRALPQSLAGPTAAALRPVLSFLSDPRRLVWARTVALAVAAHQTRLVFDDPFQH